jgi:hypothetical protein
MVLNIKWNVGERDSVEAVNPSDGVLCVVVVLAIREDLCKGLK